MEEKMLVKFEELVRKAERLRILEDAIRRTPTYENIRVIKDVFDLHEELTFSSSEDATISLYNEGEEE